MKRPVVIFVIFLVLSLGALTTAGIIWGGQQLYRVYRNFPDYAKREVVYAKYAPLLQDIDEAVEQSRSVNDLEANLRKIDAPENLAYLGLEDDNNFETDLIGSTGSVSTFVINGSGYGQINGRDIVIIHYDVDKFSEVEDCIIYLWKE